MIDDDHAHSLRCWWDFTQARWVCARQAVDPRPDVPAVGVVECAEHVTRTAALEGSASAIPAER